MCQLEAPVVSQRARRILGYSPQADILLQESQSGRRIWIELEVSRADPVANHAKFATAHMLEPMPPGDSFVSMVSQHVQPGRGNLAAHMIGVLRVLGIRAFQTLLFPATGREEIKRWNHCDPSVLHDLAPDIRPELERARAVADVIGRLFDSDIHFAANPVEVLFNVHRWNLDIVDGAQAEAWGRRRVRYFAADLRAGLFAPSKFAAYVRLRRPRAAGASAPDSPASLTGMNLAAYAAIDANHLIFDGSRAWRHLRDRLGFSLHALDDLRPSVIDAFWRWAEKMGKSVQVDKRGAMVLVPAVFQQSGFGDRGAEWQQQ